jgi:hypothetical protein
MQASLKPFHSRRLLLELSKLWPGSATNPRFTGSIAFHQS